MVVVYLMKIILRGHFLQVTLHTFLGQILLWVHLLVTIYYLPVTQTHIDQLVTQSQPSRHAVIRSTEQLYLFTSWTHSFYQTVHLVRLSACLSHFTHYYIAV